MSAYVSIRQHTSTYVSFTLITPIISAIIPVAAFISRGIRPHTSSFVSIRSQTSAYISIRSHTSANLLAHPTPRPLAASLFLALVKLLSEGLQLLLCNRYKRLPHTSAYVSLRQHTSVKAAAVSLQLLQTPSTPTCVSTCTFVPVSKYFCTSNASVCLHFLCLHQHALH
jgi:hypothetical protein